jgi:hypothetical protein
MLGEVSNHVSRAAFVMSCRAAFHAFDLMMQAKLTFPISGTLLCTYLYALQALRERIEWFTNGDAVVQFPQIESSRRPRTRSSMSWSI